VRKGLDVFLGFGGDLEGHVGRCFGAGAFHGGNFEAEVDDVVGALAEEFFEPDQELFVTELARDFDAGAGGDERDGGLRVGTGLGDVCAFVLARGLFLDGAENLPFAFEPPDGVHRRERDGAGRADVATGGAADRAVHRVDGDGDGVLDLEDGSPAGEIAELAADAGFGVDGREPGDLLTGDPVPQVGLGVGLGFGLGVGLGVGHGHLLVRAGFQLSRMRA